MSYQLEFRPVLARISELLYALLVSVEITVAAAIVGFILGIICAAIHFSKFKPVIVLVNVYVEIIRNTPFLIQLFIFYFGFAAIGFRLSAFTSAFLALAFNLAAYSTEIIRAGVESINEGQIEAGFSLGMSRRQIFIDVVLVPALRNVYPVLSSQFILMFLGSSICSAISAPELTAVSAQIGSDTFKYFEVYIVVTLLYLFAALIMQVILSLVGHYVFESSKERGTGRFKTIVAP